MINKHKYVLCTVLFPIQLWAAQPMNEGALSTQTGAVTAALPVIIAKAEADAAKPVSEQRQAQRVLSDSYLQKVRMDTLQSSVLSPYQEQKKNAVLDSKEKKKLEMISAPDKADRFTQYDFESKNIHGKVTITVK